MFLSCPLALNITLSVCLAAFSPNSYFYLSLLKFPSLQPFPSLFLVFTALSSSHRDNQCPFSIQNKSAGISLKGSLHHVTALIEACMDKDTHFSSVLLILVKHKRK